MEHCLICVYSLGESYKNKEQRKRNDFTVYGYNHNRCSRMGNGRSRADPIAPSCSREYPITVQDLLVPARRAIHNNNGRHYDISKIEDG